MTQQAAEDLATELGLVGEIVAKPEVAPKGIYTTRGDIRTLMGDLGNLDDDRAFPVVGLLGDYAVRSKLDALARRMNGLNGKTATMTTYMDVITRRSDITVGGSLGDFTGDRADGGTVPGLAGGGTVAGQRMPYGDKVLARVEGGGLLGLAPGEEVITNRNGEADAFRADRAAGRIPAYADGGTIADAYARRAAYAMPPAYAYAPQQPPVVAPGSQGHSADLSSLLAATQNQVALLERQNQILSDMPRDYKMAERQGGRR